MNTLDDKELEDQVSSADPALDENAVATQEAAADDAKSSLATGEEDDGLLSVVRDVVEAHQPEVETASPAEVEETVETAEVQTDDEDYSDVPFNKHPRFQQLLRKSKTYEQDAQRYQNVQNFMDQNGLVADEAADLLIIGGLMKTNPVEAWKRAKPTIQKLLIAAGEVLPDDLKARVQNGEMHHEAALEVSRSRAATHSMQATRSFEDQRRQQQDQTIAANALRDTANAWEQDRKAKDPNFEAKMPLLMKELVYLQRIEGVPNDPAGVRAQLQKAYQSVVLPAPAAPRPVTAQKKPITPVRGGTVAGNSRPAEMSTLDLIKAKVG